MRKYVEFLPDYRHVLRYKLKSLERCRDRIAESKRRLKLEFSELNEIQTDIEFTVKANYSKQEILTAKQQTK